MLEQRIPVHLSLLDWRLVGGDLELVFRLKLVNFVEEQPVIGDSLIQAAGNLLQLPGRDVRLVAQVALDGVAQIDL